MTGFYHITREVVIVEIKRMFGSFSVNDIGAARSFYADSLKLQVAVVGDGGPLFLQGPGGEATLVYAKPDHQPAQFTVLNLSVADIDAAADELAEHGVELQQYTDIPTDDRGIYRGQDHSTAWFSDPAGNVLSLVQEG
jgi:predicted enzyme related to lactoylglutathione lyase